MVDRKRFQQEVNEKVVAHIPERAWNATVPIVSAKNKMIYQFGTGTLFRVGDHHFLVTAGHVMESANQSNRTLGIGGSEQGYFIALTGKAIVSAEGQYGTYHDPFDIALFHLPSELVSRLLHKSFLTFSDIGFEEQSQTAVYCLFGFPGVWTKTDTDTSRVETVKYKALQYIAYRYVGDTTSMGDYQERFHLLLDAQFNEATDERGYLVTPKNMDGILVRFPRDLGGISGCSIWQIGDLQLPLEDWAKVNPRVVAVQTGVYRKNCAIKSTLWVAVSTLIHEAFPELRPAMRLWHVYTVGR